MKTLFFLACGIFLVPLAAFSQGLGGGIFISQEPKAGSGGTEAEQIADSFAGEVENQLKLAYPCAQPIKESDVGKMLEFERAKEMLDEGGNLDGARKAFNSKYLVRLTVLKMGSGRYTLNATMMNTADAQPVARGNKITDGGDAAREAVKAAAKEFVAGMSSLPFARSECNPTNLWTGTLTYTRSKSTETTTKDKTVDGTGTVTRVIKTSLNYNITIRIGLKGAPQGYFVLVESLQSNEIGEKELDCRRSFGNHPPDIRSAGWKKTVSVFKHAISNETAGVSVGVSRNQYSISCVLPAIKGKEASTEITHADGGCGEPSDKQNGPFESAWMANVYFPSIHMPLEKPDEIQGSFKDGFGGTLSWNLTRTPVRK